MKSSLRFLVLGASVVILAQACGSSDDKKKKAGDGPDYTPGGEGGEHTSAGGSKSGSGGMSGSGGVSGGGTTDGGMTMSEAGMPATTGGTGGSPSGGTTTAGTSNTDAGMAGMAGSAEAGAGGQGSTTPTCQAGFAECDNNPDTVCETPLNLVTSCGDCTTKCVSTNGGAVCTDSKCVLTCNQNYANCDSKPENGCETNLVNNNTNCGMCGKDCTAQGSTCATDVCAPINMQQAVTIGGDNSGARSWGFSPLGIIANSFNSYTLRRLTLDGQSTLTIWSQAGKTSPTEGMVVVGTDVYWSERGDTSKKYSSVVFKKSITAAAGVQPTSVFAPELSASFLRYQGNALYWTSGGYQDEGNIAGGGGYIYSRALDALETDGGTRIMTVDQGNWDDFKALAVTTDALYWVTDQNTGTQYELRTAPLNGSPVSVVPSVFGNSTLAITNYYASVHVPLVADGAYVYFGRDANDAQDGIYRYKTGLAKPERITLAPDVMSIVLDSTYVYFIQQNVGGIFRVPINGGAGGAAEKISGAYAAKLLGVDGTFVYGVSIGCCNSNFFKVIK